MKGFVRILEAIIASVIILTALTFFFNTEVKPSNWEDTALQVKAQDIVASLERNGTLAAAVQGNNPALLDAILTNQNLSMLPFTVDYSLQIKGIPNPIIYLGCDCSQNEINNLTAMLSPLTFNYKNRQIQLRIASSSVNNIQEGTNILFLFNYHNLTTAKNNVNNFLAGGGTIFMMADLTVGQVNDGVLNETFGLKWKLPAGASTGSFYQPDNENTTTFRIYKYYYNLTGGSKFQTFAFTAGTNIAVDNNTIINDGSSLIKINKELVNGNGRTVWESTYANSFNNNLTKALVLWASGESFSLDSTNRNILPHNLRARIFTYDQDPYEAILTLWNALGQKF